MATCQIQCLSCVPIARLRPPLQEMVLQPKEVDQLPLQYYAEVTGAWATKDPQVLQVRQTERDVVRLSTSVRLVLRDVSTISFYWGCKGIPPHT